MEQSITVKDLIPLIDSDILVYRCGFAADGQVKREIGDGYLEQDYLGFALSNVKEVMLEVVSLFSNEYKAYLTGMGNFREQVATILPYKGNRDPNNKPKYYKEIKEYLKERWGAEVINGKEADDAIGTEQWKAKGGTVIVSIDKDLDQIPGHHYNWVKKQHYYVPVWEANLMLFRQMLEGDRTDNIPGINGIGPKTVDRVFAEYDNDMDLIRNYVKQQYQKQYGDTWENAYHECADLLWIERVEGKKCPFL